MPVHNAQFWKMRFDQDFIPSTRLVREVFLERLLPTFSSAEDESETYAQTLWDDAMSEPYYEGCPDAADIAEAVQDASVARYLSLKGIEQGVINSALVFLYHLFEQHLMIFHRKELLKISEQNDIKLIEHKEIKKRLSLVGINQEKFQCWGDLESLRLIANTVKHSEGRASRELFAHCPQLFINPRLDGENSDFYAPSDRVFLPLFGEDIYLRPEDITKYASAIEGYWIELADAMQQADSLQGLSQN